MIDKEVSELRRRLKPERNNINKIYGCYVNESGEILSKFDAPTVTMPAEEYEKYLELLRKALSGALGRTLSELSFTTEQVRSGPEHALLMKLRNSALKDEEALGTLYEKIAGSLRLEKSGYVILLACDTYDVPFRGKDGEQHADTGDTQFTHLICSVCPVKETNPTLRYDAAVRSFRNQGAELIVSAPELGFLFPAFDDRAANLYGALFYNRSKTDSRTDFVSAVFHTVSPMATDVQKETFRDVLTDALEEECTLDLVQSVHTQLRDMTVTHKEARIPEPLRVGCRDVEQLIEDTGVSERRLAAFRVKYEQAFGVDSELPPQNLLSASQLEYKTPDVVIKVNPDRADLIELRELGGTKYLMIRADEGIELNGVAVQ